MRRLGLTSRLAAMPVRARISLLACIGATALAGCGSDDQATIPPDKAAALIAVLDGIDSNAAEGSCDIAQQQADEFRDQVDLLPAEVDDEVKQGLFEIAGQLEQLTREPSQCTDVGGTSGPTGLLEPAEQTTTSTPTTSATTTTTTTTDTAPTTTDAEPTAPDGADGGGPSAPAPAEGSPGNAPSGGIGGEKAGSG